MGKLFKLDHQSSKSKARTGRIFTSHGIIKTPAFVPVATKGSIKALSPNFIKDIGLQVAFVNTYHLVTHPGVDVIAKAGGIHKYANLDIPLMSDSGGFQVFSLARKNKLEILNPKFQTNSKFKNLNSKQGKIAFASSLKHQQAKIKIFQTDEREDVKPLVVKISDDGVRFRSVFDGEMVEFTPEKSMKYQMKIGADIVMAFDECTYYPSTHDYAEKAMERTHEWLIRCIDDKYKSEIRNPKFQTNPKSKTLNAKSLGFRAFLYGIVQGGIYKDLRKKSAEFVTSQDIDGVAIGGVSVGETKKEMRDQVRWVSDYLPQDRPVHLLGIGQIDDIFDLVKYGIDTFDCVEPTRLARMGNIYQKSKSKNQNYMPRRQAGNSKFKNIITKINIQKGIYRYNLEPVDENCSCYVCQNFTKSYLHHLFKQRELLGYSLITYHNLWVMEGLFDKIRELISNDLI